MKKEETQTAKTQLFKSISNFNEFLILNFNTAVAINSKLFPVVHVKVRHLSIVFRKKKNKSGQCFFYYLGLSDTKLYLLKYS